MQQMQQQLPQKMQIMKGNKIKRDFLSTNNNHKLMQM